MSTESILVVLRLCYINRVQLRLQLRDETALQLLPTKLPCDTVTCISFVVI